MNALVATVVGASLWLGAEAPSGAPLTSPPALFERAEPHVEDGAAHLADGEPDLAIESFRQAAPTTSDERAVIEYDVGTALLARALLKAAAAPPPQGQPPPAQPGAPPPTPDPNHPQAGEAGQSPDSADLDDARAAFERAYGLARDARLKSEAALAAGNVAAQGNDVDEAIAQYRKALVAFPKNERAKKNLRRVLEAKRAQPPPPPQQGDGENDEQDEKDQKDQKEGDEQQQKNGEKKGDEQEKGDEQKHGEDEKAQKQQDGEDEKDEKGEDEKEQKQKDGEKKDGDEEKKGEKKEDAAPQDAAQKAKKQKKDEARRLLDALRARERPLTPLEMRGQKRRQQPKGGKDW